MIHKHPTVYRLIEEFRKEHKTVCCNIIKSRTGIVYKRQPKYIEIDK